MSSLGDYFKRLGRKTAEIHVKVNRVASPFLAAGATVVGGPVLGELVAGGNAELGRYLRATQARHEGDYDDARRLGRGERKRVFIYSQAGVGAGTIANVTLAAVNSGNILTQSFLGQGGSQLFNVGGTNIFTSAPKAALNQSASYPMVATQSASKAAAPGAEHLVMKQVAPGVHAFVPASAPGTPVMGGGAGSLMEVAATGGGGLAEKLALGGLAAGQTYLNKPPVPAASSKDMNDMSAQELATMMAMLGGGGGGPSDSRAPRNAALPGQDGGGSGLLWIGLGLAALYFLS